MTKYIDFFSAKKTLTNLWVAIGTILTTFFVIQLSGTRYEGIHDEACGWFLPNTFPILSLVITGFYSNLWKENETEIKVPIIYRNIAIYLSVAYFFLFLFVLFAYTEKKGNIIDYYNHWNIILGPVQGLTTASIGAFFIKQKQANVK